LIININNGKVLVFFGLFPSVIDSGYSGASVSKRIEKGSGSSVVRTSSPLLLYRPLRARLFQPCTSQIALSWEFIGLIDLWML